MEKNIDKTNTVTGIVYPAKWDSQGHVIAVVIDSTDEDQDEYFVSPGKKGAELLQFLNKKIEAQGRISENEKGRLMIDVKSYNLIENIQVK